MSNYTDFFPKASMEQGTFNVKITDIDGNNNIVLQDGNEVGVWSKAGNMVFCGGYINTGTSSITTNAFLQLPFYASGDGVANSVTYGWDSGSTHPDDRGWFNISSGQARPANNVFGVLHLNELQSTLFMFSFVYHTLAL